MAKIEKADAAERLIIAAITMVERGEDPLATHLVATSALNVVRDLICKADQEYVSELFKRGMFILAQAHSSGEPLGSHIPTQAAAQIIELAEAIGAGLVTEPDDLNIAHEKPWELLNYIVGPSNFLKHADRDPEAALDEAHFDPDAAIAHALLAYSFLRPEHPLPDRIKPYLKERGIV